jgi:hypothetical protein
MPFPEGPWGSYIRMAPISLPNDGVVRVDSLIGNKFTGDHFRPPFELTQVDGTFTPAMGSTLAHITFTEKYNGVDYEYDADILEYLPKFFVTINGRRRALAPAGLPDDDWVGTHTT